MTTDAFQGILGQPKVRDFLRQSVSSDHVAHAYLFTGPAGSNKTQAAFALAKSLVCPKGASGPKGGACGACDSCASVGRRSHPDVHYVEPEGASGYLVEQVRNIMSDVSLAPIKADKKIYIIDRADLLGHTAANAFLKTLEEPPADVVFILLGRTRESVLPTIASRCQIVPFRHIPPSEAAGIVSQNTGANIEQSKEAIEACSGSLTKAISFLKSSGNERMHFRNELMNTLAGIPDADDAELLSIAKDIVERSKAPLDAMREEQEKALAENSDFLERSAIRQIEDKNKRRLSKGTSEFLNQALSIIESWLRDIAMVCAGTPELVINVDFMNDIEQVSHYTDLVRLGTAMDGIKSFGSALDYNVSPETCFDSVMIKISEAFNGSSSSSRASI